MPVLVSLIVVTGTVVGLVLATAGGKPAGTERSPVVPGSGSAPAGIAVPVVPLLGGTTEAGRAVPVAPASPAAGAGPGVPSVKVAPLRGLRQAGLLVVAPFSLSRHVLITVSRQPGVTSADPIEAAKVKINGT